MTVKKWGVVAALAAGAVGYGIGSRGRRKWRRPSAKSVTPPRESGAKQRDWDTVDQAAWESFPASDPPAW